MITVSLTGRLTREPELRQVPHFDGGTPADVCEVRVAARDSRGRMTFIDCVQWGAGGRAAATFLTKGSLIACTGELRLREASTAGGPRQFYSVVGRIEFLGEGRKGGATQDVTAAEADSEAVPA